jgi:hypothetical protein
MRKFIILAIAATLLFSAGLVGAQKAAGRQVRSGRGGQSRDASAQPLATAGSLTATPSTITFAANNPGSTVAGNSSATVKWPVTGGFLGTWTLSVYANSSSFAGCATVPASAVSVQCNSATANSGFLSSASCSSSSFVTLPSTAPGLQVASGSEGFGSSSYTVVLNYELTDSWEYIANTSCPLIITYTVNAP